jgi:hypothetical protein
MGSSAEIRNPRTRPRFESPNESGLGFELRNRSLGSRRISKRAKTITRLRCLAAYHREDSGDLSTRGLVWCAGSLGGQTPWEVWYERAKLTPVFVLEPELPLASLRRSAPHLFSFPNPLAFVAYRLHRRGFYCFPPHLSSFCQTCDSIHLSETPIWTRVVGEKWVNAGWIRRLTRVAAFLPLWATSGGAVNARGATSPGTLEARYGACRSGEQGAHHKDPVSMDERCGSTTSRSLTDRDSYGYPPARLVACSSSCNWNLDVEN